MVQVQVCGEELWEFTLLDHLQKHAGCRLEPLLVPVLEWMSTARLGCDGLSSLRHCGCTRATYLNDLTCLMHVRALNDSPVNEIQMLF